MARTGQPAKPKTPSRNPRSERTRDAGRRTIRSAGARLGRERPLKIEGDPLAGLAAAVEDPEESDQLLVQAWSRISEAREELAQVRQELAAERRRSEDLRSEVRRLRAARAGAPLGG
jgi:chromosome segregation ATPase